MKKSVPCWLLILCLAPVFGAAAAPSVVSPLSGVIVVKDVKAAPAVVPNDGTASINVRCTVFSGSTGARITTVWMDLSHTTLSGTILMAPVARSTVASSGEGSYEASLFVPLLSDAGAYQVPVYARDTAGNVGQGWATFTVLFRRPMTLPEIGSPAFLMALARFGGGTVTSGNRVEVLENGAKALERRLALLREARRQIDLSCYTFDQSLGAGRFMDALLTRAKAGVEVNLILNADTQVSTSPLSTLRLSAHELLWTLVRDQKAAARDTLYKGLLESLETADVHLLVASGRDMAARRPVAPVNRPPDHWLLRTLAPVEAGSGSLTKEARSRYQGPGGLPALPLLDYAVHEKILVADGARAIVGGRNLEDRYFTNWVDLDLLLEGPVVNEIQKGFFRSYDSLRPPASPPYSPARLLAGSARAGGAPVVFVESSPWNRDYHTLSALVYAIACCRKSFHATSQFIALSDCLLKDAILDAARRGVDVRILTNSAETARETSFATGYFISLNSMGDLLKAGVKIFEMLPNPKPGAPQPYLHQKEFLLDGRICAVGSFNLSMRSAYIESENLAFVAEDSLAAAREAVFAARTRNVARAVTRERYAALCAAHKTRMEAARFVTLLF